MANRESFLIRVDSDLLEAVRFAARDEMRSVNRQIEFLLRRALRDAGWPGTSAREKGPRSEKPRCEHSEPGSTPTEATEKHPEEQYSVEA
jgi:hypothetical protein